MTESAMQELERLRKENAELKKGPAITMKVSDKGCLSLYGIHSRFPVSLYKGQWLKILDMSENIRAFIAANNVQLKDKGE